jgi:hypothetical protein
MRIGHTGALLAHVDRGDTETALVRDQRERETQTTKAARAKLDTAAAEIARPV